jgi:hypothetical protein
MSNFNSTSGASEFQGDSGFGDSGFDQRNTGFQASGNNFDSDRQGLQNNLGTGRNVGTGFSDDQGAFDNQAGIGSHGGLGRSGQGQFESTGMTGGSRAPGLGGGQYGNTAETGYGQVTGAGIASEAGIPNSGVGMGSGIGMGSGARAGGTDFGRDEYGTSNTDGFGTTGSTGINERSYGGDNKSLTEKAKDIYHDLKAGTGDVSGTGPSHTGTSHTNQSLGRTDNNDF